MVILAAIIGPAALTTHPTASFPDGTQLAHPGASHLPGESTTPTVEPEPWGDLAVPDFAAVAALEPSDKDRLGIGAGSTFTLRSLTSTPATDLARGLRADPPVALAVKPGASADVALVTPVSPLVAGVRYRFRLDAPDGALAGTWAFTTRAPLHIVQTLPENQAVAVPPNTGIEVVFDQDGTQDAGSHISIKPAVSGRIEQHDRTWAFVPDKPLGAATIYTVTVTAGVGLAGSTETLESNVTFRFETALPDASAAGLSFGRPILESRPDERLVVPLGFAYSEDETTSVPDSISVDVHRLDRFDSVVDAAIALAGPDSWAIGAPTATVDTSHLTLVARVDGKVFHQDAGDILRLPYQPTLGSYVLTLVQNGPPAQMLLQVTNLSAFALTAEHSTVVWVNDLASAKAISRATVAIAKGSSLGTTNDAGLLRVTTPSALNVTARTYDAPGPAFLTVRAPDGRRLLIPIGLSANRYAVGYEGEYGDVENGTASWWLLLRTDRNTYRQTDGINVYGLIRARSDRSVPDALELRLRPYDSPVEAPIIRLPVRATERGVFSGSLKFEDLPYGTYSVDLMVGATRVSETWIEITEIRKPAFQIDVQTDRHVYVLGQQVKVRATASFYDGTPVPGLDLRFSAFDHGATGTTGGLGDAAATLRAASSWEPEGWYYDSVGVAPVHPEEGQITGMANVALLPSRTWLTGTGTVSGGRVIATGKLTWADIKGMEATLDAGGNLDEEDDGPGRAITSGSVEAKVIHLVPVRHQIGTTYDFIEKRVVPVYEYDIRKTTIASRSLTSGSDGSFRVSVAAPVATDDYQVILTARDPEGRKFVRTVYASPPLPADPTQRPFLVPSYGCGFTEPQVAGIDQPVTVTMHEGSGKVAAGGRFLFLVAENGSLAATVQDAATFSRTFRDADLPSFTVRAVWLSDQGYAVSDERVHVDLADKRVTITLKADQARYRPGQHATIRITTTGPDGRPIAADVIVRGLDQKLYTIGAASDLDPEPELMAATSAGLLQSYASHAIPEPDSGGCGAGGGGGDRGDFRDSVTFQRIRTGADGRGKVEFDLSDDLTSWHMTATAFSAKLDSGIAAVLLPVGLPFFADAVLAPEYLTGEAPVLRVRAFGGALGSGSAIHFVVTAPSLGLAPTRVDGKAFTPARIKLPTLIPGDHAIRISAETTISGRTYKDVLVRTVHVAASRLAGLAASYDLLQPGFTPNGGEGLTTYAITDAGRGRLLSLLQELAWTDSGRFDKQAAAQVARDLLIKEFGFSPTGLPASGFDASRYERSGISLLSYGSPDLFLSARAALAVPSLASREALRDPFNEWLANDTTREESLVALVGLAGIGDNVLERLQSYDPASLTVRDQLWLALGLAASGDEDGARGIERSVLDQVGQRLGPWVRVNAGTTLDNTLEASGLLLLLAGRLGDPLSHDVSRYLAEVTSSERVFPLEQIGYVSGMLDRLARGTARFAWTVAGERHEVKLTPGGAYSLVLTREQRATLSFEPLDGELAIVTTWTSSDAKLPTSTSLSVTRTITPAGDAPDDRLVRVQLNVTFGPAAVPGCYRLTDLTPSGLSAVAATAGWPGDEEEEVVLENAPYEVSGQRVSWCASPDDQSHIYAYAARVVSPGTYRWEPAMLQFELSPGLGTSTQESTFTIK